ncbi:hypothetical protein [Globicatella sanguinis]|uniref:hypothetical protein n=1 Tax=Globicatella sanguinis TaxID=13076 RepID=UPI002542B041|nr:hypothetical protein [Globicatella sanguinis]MDK7631606.1 hypothetical protein [Globicatella sanguinis]WIK66440.1 hypothetical protein CYJ72_011075 [Globicatella sanguinis]WKT55845.1 hypothetical protein Q3C38_11075 [Globicatella sanguinis]
MRKTYEVKTRTNGNEEIEFTKYRINNESSTKSILSTNFDIGLSVSDILAELCEDMEHDPLLEYYIGSGNFKLPSISMKEYDDNVSVFIRFFKI